jgi:riboflavin kinase/FMN adenylyltransferase
MKKLNIIYYPTQGKPQGRYAATIGTFDGIHLGHQSIISQLRAAAKERGLKSMAITFERHPRQVLQPEWKPTLLTTLDEKVELFAQMGIDALVILRFDREMSKLSSHQFMEQVLKRDLGVRLLLMSR